MFEKYVDFNTDDDSFQDFAEAIMDGNVKKGDVIYVGYIAQRPDGSMVVGRMGFQFSHWDETETEGTLAEILHG